MENSRLAIDEAIKSLKDFQKATVDYAFEKFYVENRNKLLVADEVGLGKTIVARGVIAKAYEKFLKENTKKEFHVIYICSNQALAAQNLKRLDLFTNGPDDPIRRLVYLARKPFDAKNNFRLSSLTPGTSFYLTRGSGLATERLIIYALLTRYEYFDRYQNGLRYLLIGGVTDPDVWRFRAKQYYDERAGRFRNDIYSRFRGILKKTLISRDEFENVFEDLDLRVNHVSLWRIVELYSLYLYKSNYLYYHSRFTVIGLLRKALTEVCLEYLNADLFILDEFQRYKELIHEKEESPATKLAREVFKKESAKILMLSATPYKPFTNRLDQAYGEDHYREFRLVLKFLMEEKDDGFWARFEEDRKAFFRILRRPKESLKDLNGSIEIKKNLENVYSNAMVRTERIVVSDDQNALLKNNLKNPFNIEVEDIKDFVQTDNIVQILNEELSIGKFSSPIEYSKSSPFPFSYLDSYKIKEKLKHNKHNKRIKKALRANAQCWIDLHTVNKYKPILKTRLPNGKLRTLLEDSFYSTGWKLLWVTPTIAYYEPTGAFAGSENFSKTLVFSSWILVPRMIATLLSYEAERLTIGSRKSVSKQERGRDRTYYQKGKKQRIPRPQLIFARDGTDQTVSNMTNFCVIYPSPTLAELYNPKQNLLDNLSAKEIRKNIITKVRRLIQKYNLNRFVNPRGESKRWYWAAPILLDKFNESARKIVKDWIDLDELSGDIIIDPEAKEDTKSEKSGQEWHFSELYKCFETPEKINLGKIPRDLPEVLADMILGSPAVAAYRSLNEFFISPEMNIKGAMIIAKSFLSLYNKPESIAIIRMFTRHNQYWRKALEYGSSGNIQALLDEYIYLLHECENFDDNVIKLASHLADVMNIRTSNIRVDSLKSFYDPNYKPTMRCHYALDFGNQKIETASGKNRIVNLKEAFNSPFRPFVLASTSIGQEGLDFHYYCRKIMHWNLPYNAIDIEQREGRINRYKGMVIRQIIAAKYLKDLSDPNTVIWKELFDIAKKKEQNNGKCDLVPFWHVESNNGIKIERIVPLHPYSKDIKKFKNLLDVLTYYRLTFGQPRQEELVEAIMGEKMEPDELDLLRNSLMINLSPISKKYKRDGGKP